MPMILIDAFFRFTGVGLLLLLAAKIVMEQRGWRSTPYLFLSCLSVAALFMGYTPEAMRLPDPYQTVMRFIDVPHLIFVWLFALSLFSKDFSLRFFHWVVGLTYCAPIFWGRLADTGLVPAVPSWVIISVSVLSIMLMGHLAYTTLLGRADDLLEKRRASRLYFVAVILVVAVAAAVTESALIGEMKIDNATIKILCIWPAIVWGSYWLLSINKDAQKFSDDKVREPKLETPDQELKLKLEQEMTDRQAFKEHDLKISTLANRLGVSQHRLRSLINQTLGYQNFSTFINKYRVKAIKDVFDDFEKKHIPILTIAMDCGFSSLSPFNHAFKLEEGVTPSEYRKRKYK